MKMRMVLSETPLKEFGHSDCNTEGWAEQVTYIRLYSIHDGWVMLNVKLWW